MLFRILYTLLLALAAPFLLYSLYKNKLGKPKIGVRWKEHFGITPPINAKNPIWIHAVSVGEVIAAIPVIKAIKQHYPNRTIVVTTTTSTGAEQVQKLGDLVIHRYMPIDFSWCVRRFLNSINPSVMLIMETELWPNTLATVHKAKIPIIVMNARLSEKSANRYHQFSALFNLISPTLDKVLCLHKDDAQRFIGLGISPEKVIVTGSVKFDIQINESIQDQATELRSQLGADRPIWIAASTHKNEDEKILSAFKQIKVNQPNSLLILVPRHPERFNTVAELCQKQNFQTARRTQNLSVTSQIDVYIGDTMGEMLILIGAADIVFMAGSLLGDSVGGHNMLEPAALAKPVITGPSFYNFTDITIQLQNAGGLLICQNEEQLAKQVSDLMANPEQQKKMGEAALDVVKRNQGAVAKTLSELILSIEERDNL